MQGVWRSIVIVVLTLLSVSLARAEKRVALVIGNSNYAAVAQLPNPANDAAAFAKVLTGAGFDSVTLKTDLGIDAFRQSLRDFTTEAADADIAVFYYAGHGLEVGGVNLLVPIDAKLRTDLDAEDETISIDRVLRALEQTRRLRLVILDACRENPFVPAMKHVSASRSVSRGFQRIEAAPPDTMIAFATEPGSIAADGNGRNSPFTQALVEAVAIPGLDLRIALGKVRDDVLKATGGRQRPYVTGSLGGTNEPLIAGNQPAVAPNEPPKPVSPPPAVVDSGASDFKFAEGVASPAGWQAFLRLHPHGPLSDVAIDRLAELQKAASDDPAPPQQQARLEPQPPPATPRTFTAPPGAAFVVGGLDPNGDNFLALRSAPGTSTATLRQLPAGTSLAVDDRSGSWVHVTTAEGDRGWVYGRYVLPQGHAAYQAPPARSQSYAFVTGLDPNGDNFLALKAAPDIHATRLLKMGPGTRLLVTGRSGDWTRVQVPGGPSGWASGRYIGCCTAGP